MRPQVQKMQERILLVAYVHESGVEAGGHFSDLREVDIAHGKAAFGLLAMKFGQDLVLHQGDGHLGGT